MPSASTHPAAFGKRWLFSLSLYLQLTIFFFVAVFVGLDTRAPIVGCGRTPAWPVSRPSCAAAMAHACQTKTQLALYAFVTRAGRGQIPMQRRRARVPVVAISTSVLRL